MTICIYTRNRPPPAGNDARVKPWLCPSPSPGPAKGHCNHRLLPLDAVSAIPYCHGSYADTEVRAMAAKGLTIMQIDITVAGNLSLACPFDLTQAG
jgi:hypothetical protein